jgi:hypothetical protein
MLYIDINQTLKQMVTAFYGSRVENPTISYAPAQGLKYMHDKSKVVYTFRGNIAQKI